MLIARRRRIDSRRVSRLQTWLIKCPWEIARDKLCASDVYDAPTLVHSLPALVKCTKYQSRELRLELSLQCQSIRKQVMATDTTWQDLLQPGKATDFFARREFVPFDPTRSDYCVANAVWLAELSRLVYRHDTEEDAPPPEPTRTNYLERAGLRQRRFFKVDAGLVRVRALLVESVNENFAALVFRGTEQ